MKERYLKFFLERHIFDTFFQISIFFLIFWSKIFFLLVFWGWTRSIKTDFNQNYQFWKNMVFEIFITFLQNWILLADFYSLTPNSLPIFLSRKLEQFDDFTNCLRIYNEFYLVRNVEMKHSFEIIKYRTSCWLKYYFQEDWKSQDFMFDIFSKLACSVQIFSVQTILGNIHLKNMEVGIYLEIPRNIFDIFYRFVVFNYFWCSSIFPNIHFENSWGIWIILDIFL